MRPSTPERRWKTQRGDSFLGLVAASTAALTACFQAVSYELFVLVYRVRNADWTNASLIFGFVNGLNDFVGGFGIDYFGGSLRSRTTTLGVVGIVWSLMCLLPYYPLFVTHRAGVHPDAVIPSSGEILDLFSYSQSDAGEEDPMDHDYGDVENIEPPETVNVGWKFTLLSLTTLDTGATLCTLMTGALLVAVTHSQKERVHIAFVSEMASLLAAFFVRFTVAAAWETATGAKPHRPGVQADMDPNDFARFEEDELEEAVISRFWPLVVLISLASCVSFLIAMISFLGRYCVGKHEGKMRIPTSPEVVASEALEKHAPIAVRDGSLTLNSRTNQRDEEAFGAKLVNVAAIEPIVTDSKQASANGGMFFSAEAEPEPFSLRDFLQILCVQQNFWAFLGTNMLLEVQVTTFYTFCLIYGRTLLPEGMRHLIIAVIPLASSLVYLFKILPFVEERGVNDVYRGLISFKLYAAFFSAIFLIPFGRHAVGVFMTVDAILTGATASLFSITMGEVIDEGHNLHVLQRGMAAERQMSMSPSFLSKHKVDDDGDDSDEEEQPRFAACYAGVYGLFAKTLACVPSIIGAGYGLGLESGEEDMKLVTIFVLILPFLFALLQRICWSGWTLSGSESSARSKPSSATATRRGVTPKPRTSRAPSTVGEP